MVLATTSAPSNSSPGAAASGSKGLRISVPRTSMEASVLPARALPCLGAALPTAMMRILPLAYCGTVKRTSVPLASTGTISCHRAKGGSPLRLKGLRKRPPGPDMSPPKPGMRPRRRAWSGMSRSNIWAVLTSSARSPKRSRNGSGVVKPVSCSTPSSTAKISARPGTREVSRTVTVSPGKARAGAVRARPRSRWSMPAIKGATATTCGFM